MEAETAVGVARRLAKVDPPELAEAGGPHGAEEVERLIPHRPPFRFVDGISGLDLEGRRMRGFHDVSAEDPVFEGHFPGEPVFPAVLQVEAVGQLGLCLVDFIRRGTTDLPGEEEAPADIRAVRVHHAVFLHPVRPGARLDLYAEVLELDDFLGVVGGQVRCGRDVSSSAVLEVYFV